MEGKITFKDASTNEMTTYEQEVRIDSVDPEIKVTFDNNNVKNGNCYAADRKATVMITEHNFKAEDVKVVVTAKDILSETVSVMDYTAYAADPANWISSGDVHTLKLNFTKDAIYVVTVNYTDLAGNAAEEYKTEFVIDHTDANNIKITYSTPTFQGILEKLTFGFYKADVVVTVTAEDMTSGVDYFELIYTKDKNATNAHTEDFVKVAKAVQDAKSANVFTASYTIPAQARGSFGVKVYDRAGNDSYADDQNRVNVTDTVAPQVSVNYAAKGTDTVIGYRDAAGNVVKTFGEAANAYYNGDVVATITVNEANFFEGKTSGENGDKIVHQILIKVTKTDDNGKVTVTEYLCAGAEQLVDDANVKEIAWQTNGDVHTTSIEFADDGDYVVEIMYVDFSGNRANINGADGKNGEGSYVSKVITVDETAPVIHVSYDNNSLLNGNCYKDNRVATISVTEHNFKAEEFVATVTAVNILGQTVATTDFAAFAANPANWTHTGNVHTLQLTFATDAIYTFDVSYTDKAGNAAADFTQQSFVVDHAGASNIQITYSTPVFAKIIEALTFGFYKADVVVTVTAEDITSGVDFFELSYTRDEDATDAHMDDFMQTLKAVQNTSDAKTFTASYTVPAEARGSYSVKVVDRAGNTAAVNDRGNVIVTDTVSPEIEVSFTGKDANTMVHFVDGNMKDVEAFTEATNAFYNGNVVVTITVNEANFFEGKASGANSEEVVHEIIIKVTKTDDDGNVTITEYLCAGADQLVEGAQTAQIVWNTTGDTHTTSIEFADDGDYVLEITYADFSENDSAVSGNDGVSATKTYTSKIVTVDKTAPVVTVEYGNTDVINLIDNIEYFNKGQSAVITVTEHNFRAEDVVAVITAKDVLGKDVDVADFAAQLADEKNWSHDGNVHTAKVEYTVDANYTFDFDLVDIALNASAEYEVDLFTVDTTAPINLTISYSTNVFEEILESITFGYYNAKVTVTISATDLTSGIYHFAYSYINSQGVSSVNAELLNQAVQSAKITYKDATGTVEFEIPKMVLGDDNQFNGTVEFTAYDRSENNTELKDDVRIVVDNISPTATITYNDPVQRFNDISYYDGNIDVVIEINEANFDFEDVQVIVTKDGTAYPITTTWVDNSVDVHTGSFTLTQDGDYIVSVQYKDKSGNQMNSYTSNVLTLDTTTPVITVSNIKVNSANKDEQYGFVIEINDTNLDVSSLKPVLKAVVQSAEGVYEIVEIDLGEAVAVTEGKTYTYTVENLPDDALYTLSCEAKDMAHNAMIQVVLDDGIAYDQVQFSINRNGSTFGYGNTFTEELVGQYYIYSVDEDVVIVEVNVDPIEIYKVALNGVELTEGSDYTTEQSSKEGEWSIRTYTVNKDLFTGEGEYSLVVTSVDKASTTAYSDVKNLSMAFVVDQTKPAMTVTGLETGGRYQTNAQTVILIPTDEGGRLNSLTVIVMDADGNPLVNEETGENISVRFEMSGEELLAYLEENDGKVTFTIPEGLNNQVEIVCNDCAVGAEGLTNEYSELFENVTVSQNQLVIFYANKPLFFGTIAGVLASVALIVVLIKRRKNKQTTAKI